MRWLRAIVAFFGGTLGTLAVTVVWLLLIAGSALAHADLPVSRRVLASYLSNAISAAMRGDLAIGSLEHVGMDGIVAHNVELFDGDGRRVVHGERLRLVPDWGAWRWSPFRLVEVRFGRAELDGATAYLVDQGDGLPTLIASFDAPPGAAPSTGGAPLLVNVSGIEITHLTLEGELLGLRDLRATGVHATGVLDIAGPVHVHIVSATGTVVEPFGFPGSVDALAGTISTVPTEGVALRARVHRGDERAAVRVRYAGPAGEAGELRVDVRAQNVTTGTLQALHYDFIPALTCPLSGDFTLYGPIDDFRYAASLDTPAGHADLDGRTEQYTGTTLSLRTQGLALAQVWEGAPDVTARGTLRVDSPPEALHPYLHIAVEPILYDRYAIPGFALDGALTDEGLRIDALHARSKNAELRGGGTIRRDGALDVKLRARFRDIGGDENLRKLVPNARGGLDADVALRTAGLGSDFVHAQGRVTLTRFVYDDVAAERLVLEGFVHGKASRPRAKLAVTGKALRVGSYLLGDPMLALEGGPRVYHAKGQFDAAGRRTFDVDATLTAEPNGALIEASSIEVAVGDGTWRGALSALHLRGDGVIELGQLRLASRSQRLEAKGVIRVHGPDEIDAQLQDFDLAVVRALIGEGFWLQNGRADATVVLRGDVRDPVLDVQGALRGGTVAGITDVNALYLVRYAHGALQADGEVDLGGRGVIQLRGEGTLDPNLRDAVEALRLGRYDFEMIGEELQLTLLPELRARGVRGRLGGTLRWKGSIDAPEASGRVELHELELPGMSAIDVALTGGYVGERLRADVAVSDRRGPLLTAGGALTLDGAALRAGPDAIMRRLGRGPWQVRGQTTGRRLDAMPLPLRDAAPYPALVATTFDLMRDGSGTHGSLELDARWDEDLRDSTCASSARPRAHAQGTLANGIASLDVTALVGPWRVGQFAVELRADVDRWLDAGQLGVPTVSRAKGGIDLRTLEHVPYLCEYGDGALSAQLDLACPTGAEPHLSIGLQGSLQPAVAKRRGAPPAPLESCRHDPVRVVLAANADGPTIDARGTMAGCGTGSTALNGTLPIEWGSLHLVPWFDQTRDVDLRVRFDDAQLKPLLELLPGVTRAEGLARGEVRVQGKLAHPDLSGHVDVRAGKVFLLSTGQTFTDLTARLEMRGNWIKIDRLSAYEGKGLLEAAGGLGLDGLSPQRARIAVRTERLPIKQEGVDLGSMTGAAAIDARFEEDRLRAQIMLHSLIVRLPHTTNRTLQPLDAHPDVKLTTAEPEPPPAAYTVELTFDGKRGLSVRRNDFEAQIATQVSLRYRDPQLRASGYVQFLGGEFGVFGKEFEINSGSLRFDAEREELDPQVFLLATQKPEAGQSPVTVTVTGTLSKPSITFASDACPGESGAVTYLVSGECVADDPDLAQDANDAEGAFASGMLAGVLTLGAQQQLSTVMPRFGYSRSATGETSGKLGFSSTELVPKALRPLVRRVYVQGAVTTPGQTSSGSPDAPSAADAATASPSLDFLLELYFRNDIVGAGRFGEQGWGLDLTWEP